MLKEIQFQRHRKRIFMLDTDYKDLGDYECHDDYWPGYNSQMQERESLPNGTYNGITAEVTYGKYGPAFGNFYITTGDERGRDIHGGGSNSPEPYADYQGWYKTLGCLRMQNADGVELSKEIIRSTNASIDVVLTVVN